jgi:hypothetical protein
MPDSFVFEDSYNALIRSAYEKAYLSPNDIIDLIHELQNNESDTHVVIAGQNGSGKTFLELILLKLMLGPAMMDNLFLSDKTSNDIVKFLLERESTVLGIDELNLYLNYKLHATTEQNHLITMIELARSKMIAFIGCVRDARKLALNYRNGKMSVVILILDRWKSGKGAYAAVFVANHMVEGEDRFHFQMLDDISSYSFESLRYKIEQMPSFIGYMKIPSASKVLTKEEISLYKERKKIAMAYAHLNYCIKMFKKDKMDTQEFNSQVEILSRSIPDIESILKKNLEGGKGKQKTLLEDD